MKKHLLIATTATALLASASFTFAQKGPDSASPPAAPSASPASPGAASDKGAAPDKMAPGKGAATDKMAPSKGASTQTAPTTKDKAAQSAPAGGEKMTQAPKTGADSQMGPNNKMDTSKSDTTKTDTSKTQAQTPSTPSTQTQSSQSGTSPSTDRNAASKPLETNANASLSTEQRTKIRETVVKQSNAPKLSRNEVNFSLSVGTVVPRSVHVAVLPATVIEIYPAWRGYEYVLVGDEIVILEPGTLRIVAIIPA
ncbi:MAG: DUF1236 domain-containing protein [Xanthobacteraceae bacterium]